MHHSQPLYRCGLEEHWRRQIGDLQPNSFARVIGGCEVCMRRSLDSCLTVAFLLAYLLSLPGCLGFSMFVSCPVGSSSESGFCPCRISLSA
jgi:hypothetical protein